MRGLAKKQDHIIEKVSKSYWKTSRKFGIRATKTVGGALQIDKERRTEFRRRSIENENIENCYGVTGFTKVYNNDVWNSN